MIILIILLYHKLLFITCFFMQYKKKLVVWVNTTFTSLKWLCVIQKQTFFFCIVWERWEGTNVSFSSHYQIRINLYKRLKTKQILMFRIHKELLMIYQWLNYRCGTATWKGTRLKVAWVHIVPIRRWSDDVILLCSTCVLVQTNHHPIDFTWCVWNQ